MDLPLALGPDAWNELDSMILRDDYWSMLMPSHFARSSPELEALARELGVDKRNGRDPLELLRDLNADLYRSFSYVQESTAVDSPIEEALRFAPGSVSGLCPHYDFAGA